MTTAPYAKTMMQIDGGGSVFGGQVVAGSNVVQLLGESTVQWTSQLWEIYEYPLGYPLPAGWVSNNGIFQNSSVLPPTFTLSPALTRWGKYLFRLTVNGGLLNGVYSGPSSPQPLVYEASALHVKSPYLQLSDVGFRETNQFDSIRQWMGELKATLRQIDSFAGGGGPNEYFKSLAAAYTNSTNVLSDTLLTFPIGANEIWYAEYDMTVTCTGVGGTKFAVDIPTGAVIEGALTGFAGSFAVPSGSRINADNTVTTNAVTSVAGTLPARVWIRVKNGSTPGTVILRAQSTTNTQTSTLQPGAVMKATRVTEI